MKKMYTFLVACLIATASFGQDTFSIIAVDPETGEIGSAGASCVTGVGSGGIIDIITKIIPGRGGVNSQAYVCIPNVNLNNAIDQMEMGATPTEIIDFLIANDACSSQNFNPQFRQYGIADFDMDGNPRVAGFTGSMADDYKEDRQGATFSIQGNILLDQTVIDNMEDNFNNTAGTLADKLMAAMQGANFAGADSRCLGAGTSSTTAYLLVYKEDDAMNDPYLRLNVGQQASGVEPIDILQGLYDGFLSVQENSLQQKVRLFPNPVSDVLHLSYDTTVALSKVEIFNMEGKKVFHQDNFQDNNSLRSIDVSQYNSGVYFIRLQGNLGEATIRFVKR